MTKKNRKVYTMDAFSDWSGSMLRAPNLHFRAWRRPEDNVMVGHCLDFGIYVYSEQDDDRDALDHLFKRLVAAAKVHLLGHLRRNTVSNLFDNASPLESGSDWGQYAEASRKGKIGELIRSYRELKVIVIDRLASMVLERSSSGASSFTREQVASAISALIEKADPESVLTLANDPRFAGESDTSQDEVLEQIKGRLEQHSKAEIKNSLLPQLLDVFVQYRRDQIGLAV